MPGTSLRSRMRIDFIRAALPAFASLALLSACSATELWPFGGAKRQELSRTPSNATEYQCNNGRRLYVRYLDNGAAAWVIFPEREFRLDKVASAEGARYSNGVTLLETSGNEARLLDGPAAAFTGCKAGGGGS